MFENLIRRVYSNVFRSINHIQYKNKNRRQADPTVQATTQAAALAPSAIPKFVSPLIVPPVYKPIKVRFKGGKIHYYYVDISEFQQQILPDGFPKTKVWGYGGFVTDPQTGRTRHFRSIPGPTFEAVRGIPVIVKWINRLTGPHLFAVDPTLHWANPSNMPMDPPKPWPPFPPGFHDAQKQVPVVTHLHGGEHSSISDGHPDAWFTYDRKKGPAFTTSIFKYPNMQKPTTLWYHDHTLGITRLNVYAGLAGFYLLRNHGSKKRNRPDPTKAILPCGKYEIPMAIQDRSFKTDGSLAFNNVGVNPEIHPYWQPEFFGNTVMVNGRVWPNLDVEPRQYRFRFLNGSNARFYNMKLSNGMKFVQIGSDGGYLPKPVELDSILLSPAERADVLVDFSGLAPGTSIILLNDANAPFPDGDPPDRNTVGKIMQFKVPVNAPAPVKPQKLPDKLNIIPDIIPDSPRRILTLNEVQGPNGPVLVLLNGQKWESTVSELPRVGSTEEWVIVNLTMDSHPIHLHLVQFQVYNRQDFDTEAYRKKWEKINGSPPLNHPTTVLPVKPYLVGDPVEPPGNERGWKDTVRMDPNQVTRIRVRFAPQDIPVEASEPGMNFYPFDPAAGPGYVWHCHILDHEDNEMMRPLKVKE